MATTLKAIIPSGSVAAGATAVLPHTLNIDDVGQVPDVTQVDNNSFAILSADATNVTVQNTGSAAAATNVYCESWYSSERTFGNVATTALTPQPFVPAGSISSGVAAATFVYQPGGTAVGNVFTDWTALMTALSSVRGIRNLEFDDSIISPAVIPAGGPYDMKGVIWRSRDQAQFTSVDVADGASFTNLRNWTGNLTARNLNTTTPPITDLAAFDNIYLLDGANIECGAGAVPWVDATGLSGGAFLVVLIEGQSTFGLNPGGGVPVFDNNVAGVTFFFTMGNGGPQRNSIAGVAGASIFIQITSHHAVFGPQPAFLGSTTIAVTNPAPRRNILPGPGSTPYVGPTTVAIADVSLADVSGGAFALTLPTLPGGSFNSQGVMNIFKEVSGSAGLTVAPGGANTIDGVAAAVPVPAGGSLWLMSDGVSNWINVS